jgi:hypothetical protein
VSEWRWEVTSAALVGLLLRQPFLPFALGEDDGDYVERPSQVKHQPGHCIVTVTAPRASDAANGSSISIAWP